MTRETLERLAFIAAHQILALEGESSLRIPGKQYACAGRRRTEFVDRVAACIASTFEGAEQAELRAMVDADPHERIRRR